jgi:hypothetical protein
MDAALARRFRFLALQLVGATAVIHLVYALPRLRLYTPTAMAVYAEQGILPPPRPALFLLSGLAIFVGVLATARGLVSLGTAYRLGVALLVVLVVSWVGWHTLLDHGAVLSGAGQQSVGQHGSGVADHHTGILDTVLDHYVEPLVLVVEGAGQPGLNTAFLAVVSKSIELTGIGLLVLLLRGDPAVDRTPRYEDHAPESAT